MLNRSDFLKFSQNRIQCLKCLANAIIEFSLVLCVRFIHFVRIEWKGGFRYHHWTWFSFSSVFRQMVCRIWMFYSLKPSAPQGELSLKINLIWRSRFGQKYRQTNSMTYYCFRGTIDHWLRGNILKFLFQYP